MIEYINKEVARRIIDSERTREQMLAVLSSAVPADVRENVHGKWVLEHLSQLWECTNCHEREIRTTDFCPNCGADMRGDKDEQIH